MRKSSYLRLSFRQHEFVIAKSDSALTFIISVLLGALLVSCTTTGPPPLPTQERLEDTDFIEQPQTEPHEIEPSLLSERFPSHAPEWLLNTCIPEESPTILDIEIALSRYADARDTRCWTAAEIALANRLLDRSHGLSPDKRDLQRRAAGYRFRQAELRAQRFAYDDLAALALFGRAHVAMRDREQSDVYGLLTRSVLSVGLHAASTGEALYALDPIHFLRMIEALAAWERTNEHNFYAQALESASQLKFREALRAFSNAAVDRLALAEAYNPNVATALQTLSEWSKEAGASFGAENRLKNQHRSLASESLLQGAPHWVAAAPLLLGWLPAEMPEILMGLQAVLAPEELYVDYTIGIEHSVLLAITENELFAYPLPGRRDIERLTEDCLAGDCSTFERTLLAPLREFQPKPRQVLLSLHDILHQAPFESLIEPRTIRTPSALGLTILRLREWRVGPRAHPQAALLLDEALKPTSSPTFTTDSTQDDSTQDDPKQIRKPDSPPRIHAIGDTRAIPTLWASLAAGYHLIDWVLPNGSIVRKYGAPLTLPGADLEPEDREDEDGLEEHQLEEPKQIEREHMNSRQKQSARG